MAISRLFISRPATIFLAMTTAEDLKTKPRDFCKTFKPFLSTKDCSRNVEIQLNVNGLLLKIKSKKLTYW